MKQRISWWIASAGGAGWLPKAPGTWGSLVGLLSFGFLPWYTMVAISLFGWWCTHNILSVEEDRDPQAIVIDEVSGMWLALWVCGRPLMGWDVLGIFLAFRVLDIIKPFPIGYIDRRLALSARWAPLGVMLDDWLAGLIAGFLWRAPMGIMNFV